MASSSLDFVEEKMSEPENVAQEKLSGNLIQEQETIPGSCPSVAMFGETGKNSSHLSTEEDMIDLRMLPSRFDHQNVVYKRRKFHQNNVGAASEMGASKVITYQRRRRSRPLLGPSSAYAEDGIASRIITYQRRARPSIAPLSFYARIMVEHLVEASFVPTLRFIFAKHGNIAADALFIFPGFITTLLEIVCDVVQKLIRNDFGCVLSELDTLMILAEVVEMGHLDVSWLKKYLAEIDEVRKLTIKAATKDFDAREEIMVMAKKRFKEVQRSVGDPSDIVEDGETDEEI